MFKALISEIIGDNMNLLVWISLVFNALLTIALLVIRHKFDKKLEILRADLHAKDAQIDFLRSGAMSALANRQSELYKRRIEAVCQLWSAFVDLAPARTASAFMVNIKFEESLAEVEKNPQFKKIFETLGKFADLSKINSPTASKVRPFVSEIAWALFSAYQAIALFAVLQLEMLKTGFNEPKLLDEYKISDLINAALPHQSQYLKEHGSSGYHFLLEELESRLLKELQNILNGEESDKYNVEQTAKIMEEAALVMQKISDKTKKEQVTPN